MKENKITKTCDHCKGKEAESSHAIITELKLCSSCAILLKDDKLSKCASCGEDVLKCICRSYTIREAQNELNEASDLCVCLFVLSNSEEMDQFEGKPHLTLLNEIGNKIMNVTLNLTKVIHE